jgi:5-methylthioadenosine/S-adenosylhomocysteine deaminase
MLTSYRARRGLLLKCLCFLLALASAHAQTSGDAKLLVQNAYLMTMAPSQKKPFLGYLAVGTDGKILAVGEGAPPAGLHAQTMWDAGGHWVLPGFISAHSHLWQSALRGFAADQTLTGWITAIYADHAAKALPEDMYWFTLDGALDHLQHGITAAYSFNYGGSRLAADLPADEAASFDGENFRGEAESGIRFVYGIDAGHATALGQTPAFGASEARVPIARFLTWSAHQPGADRMLSVKVNGLVSFNSTEQQAVMEKALMDEFHLGNQEHYLEAPDTQYEDRTKFRWLLDHGLVSRGVIFGHFIHTDPYILAEAAKGGASMSWNPLSNGRLASGVPDIPAYLKAGLRVGMGVDGEASADLADPFENMRTGLYAIRDKYEDATVMSPYDVLRLATLGSADALSVADRLGSLEPGKLADFIVVDPTRFRTVTDPYASLVFIAAERDLDRVYVGGELMVDHGTLQHADATKVRDEVEQRVARINAASDAPPAK